MKKLLFVAFFLTACGKDPVPPGEGPKPLSSFEVSGSFIEVKGTVKKGSVAEAKAAVTIAVRELEK